MADVRKYTEQIASAKKGKDVRAAIVSAINEVSDENNTYNQTKADIQAAQSQSMQTRQKTSRYSRHLTAIYSRQRKSRKTWQLK